MQPKEHEHEEFDSGAKRSDRSGKGRFDLVSPYGLQRLAVQYEEGGKSHASDERNWEQGFPISRALCSAIGHINEQLKGDRSEDHLAAAAWQLFCAMHFEELIKLGQLDPKWNDLPVQPPLGLLDVIAIAQVNIPKDTIITADMDVYQAIMKGQIHGEIVRDRDRFILQCREEKPNAN